MLSHEESRIIVSRITKTLQIASFYSSLNICLANSPYSLVTILALLLFVLCRMFFHHVSLEIRGLSALVVAVITGKGLLTSVRSQVFSFSAGLNAGKVALVTLKRLLA